MWIPGRLAFWRRLCLLDGLCALSSSCLLSGLCLCLLGSLYLGEPCSLSSLFLVIGAGLSDKLFERVPVRGRGLGGQSPVR